MWATDKSLLSRLLEMYFSMRLLCICPEEVKSLRLVVWRCCAADIFSNPLVIEAAPTLQQTSIADCKKYIRSGKALCGSSRSGSSGLLDPTPIEIQTLSDVLDMVVAVLKRAYECRDPQEAIELLRLLEPGETMGVSLHGEFAYAQVKSLVMVCSSGAVAGGQQSREAGVEHAGVYCWCRGVDDGEPMVLCESCGEWFHYSCAGILNRKHLKSLQEIAYSCIACSVTVIGQKYLYEWPSNFYGSINKSVVIDTIKVEETRVPTHVEEMPAGRNSEEWPQFLLSSTNS
jgi:hypothetical protein